MKKYFTILLVCLIATLKAQVDKTVLKNHLYELGYKWITEEQLFINSSHTDKQTQITHIYFKQQFQNSEIYNTQSSIHLDKNGKVFNKNLFLYNTAEVANSAKYDASQALSVALTEANIPSKALNKAIFLQDKKFEIKDKAMSSAAVKGKQVFFIKDNKLFSAWQIEVLNDETNDWLDMVIDAGDGSIIHKSNYTTKCNPAEMAASKQNKPYYFNFDDEPTLGKADAGGTYRVFPIPLESPARGNRKLVNNAYDVAASPYGWHDDNGIAGAEYTITRGNNVWAKEDTLATNGDEGYSPDAGANLVFDYEYNLGANPRSNLNAAITNLYFWNNTMHDVFYHYGFDEEAGNYQNINYTGQGQGNDFVFADAQDGSGTNNANFSAPADGTNGRMQMYLWVNGTTSTKNAQIQSPAAIAGQYNAVQSSFGPKLGVYPITGQLVLVNGGGTKPAEGCSTPLVNAADVNGKIALIDRGTCGFVTKVNAAQQAGAIAVIVFNNSTQAIYSMTGSGASGITIPSVMMSQADGVTIKKYLDSGIVTLSLFDSSSVSLTSPTFDSDFDNGVIAHEYGHGISGRLTGGAANSSCLTNQEQAGEGWSDFFALVLTSKPYETTLAGRGMGTHLINQDTNGLGIRNYKYSRDMTINPATYNSIKTFAIPHGVGFVWCSMLYDMYLAMIDRYGFDENVYTGNGGNNKALRLVVEGLKLQPCNPGFVDSRDAILKADSILNGNVNKDIIWKAFARRGLGFSASQGAASSRSDGTQAFDLPAGLSNSIAEQNVTSSIKLFPNPSSNGKFSIHASNNLGNCEYTIFDVSGKVLQSSTISISENTNDIDIAFCKAGIYLITIKSSEGSTTKKLIIE